MPFYPVAGEAVEAAYIALAAEHNNPATEEALRQIAYWKAAGIREAVTLIYGNVAGGELVMAGDRALPDNGRPACGGFYVDMDEAAPVQAEVA